MVEAKGPPNSPKLVNGVQVLAIKLDANDHEPPDPTQAEEIYGSIPPYGGQNYGGRFRIFAPPGKYRLRVESIKEGFVLPNISIDPRNITEQRYIDVTVEKGRGRSVDRFPVVITPSP